MHSFLVQEQLLHMFSSTFACSGEQASNCSTRQNHEEFMFRACTYYSSGRYVGHTQTTQDSDISIEEVRLFCNLHAHANSYSITFSTFDVYGFEVNNVMLS